MSGRHFLKVLAACAALASHADLARATGTVTGGIVAPPQAADPHPEGWQTWTWGGNCYAINYARGPVHDGVQNGDTFIAVKHLPREHNYDNVSIVSGFGDVTGISATIEVDGNEFPLLVYGNAGFVRSGEPERRLIDLLDKASVATVTWFRKDGLAVQTYDVKGFPLAKKTIDTACPHVETASASAANAVATDQPAKPATKPAPAPARAVVAHKRKRH